MRMENLSMSHYQLVAGKTDEEKRYYLDHASQQNMSVSQLRQFIKQHELPDTVNSTKPSHIPDAQERFSQYLTPEQFNRMSADEQVEFWQWWQEQTERIRQWIDGD